MQHPNAKLIEQFYTSFQALDAESMSACYAENIEFSDPVFTHLSGSQAGDMWRMLCSRAQDFSLKFDGIDADDQRGRAHWVATYVFSQTGRTIVNDIHASFEFKDGKIVKHKDHFDLWKWARQALGIKGLLLGWSSFVQGKIQHQAQSSLTKFSNSRK
ncbi:nuclear transport factor 2 family protein [Undibacterium sp. LX40W]|uniref:Nuclear transport factor 2 family protein n=1 Tax=Undibacterium nitidum TaxID=2762298 RepID=A0A923HQ10_9BURK|nr:MULTISPECIES: nuclear transport factor 2 family protein [Undibacterium]MBC3881813.1 nuclear transport factor 2 family protein [Undibacterium nitidum]MBC3892190.1 nuclear transport factor 2 family protein [Undibacterium sp. LX40W]